MNININVATNDSCGVIVQDLTEYLPESATGTAKYYFKASEAATIDVLRHNKVSGEEIASTTYGESGGEATISISFDGWFTIVHIVLPNKEWLEEQLNSTAPATELYPNGVYYTDGSAVYKYADGQSQEVEIEEIIEINETDTTVLRVEEDYVSICYLKQCYINYCQLIFESRTISTCWNGNDLDSDLVYKRDLTWMAINVIEYMTECEQLVEVARMLEVLEGCNGLCSTSDSTSNSGGCGCNK